MTTMTERKVSYDACIDFAPEGGFDLTICRTIPSGISGPFATLQLNPVTNAIEDIILEANMVLLDHGYFPSEKWRVHQNGIVWADLIKFND